MSFDDLPPPLPSFAGSMGISAAPTGMWPSFPAPPMQSFASDDVPNQWTTFRQPVAESSPTLHVNVVRVVRNETGSVFVNEFKVVRRIGGGAFGSVYLVEKGPGVEFAMKVISRRRWFKESLQTYPSIEAARPAPRPFADLLEAYKRTLNDPAWPASPCADSNKEGADSGPPLAPTWPPRRVLRHGSAREVHAQQELCSHPNIVTLHAVLNDRRCFVCGLLECPDGRQCPIGDEVDRPSQDRLCLVQEYCAGGELLSPVTASQSSDSEPTCRYESSVFSRQICDAVAATSSAAAAEPGLCALGGLPLNFARQLLGDLVSALAHTHASGVVHRDIKPENVVVNAAGAALLADWGTAVQMDVPLRGDDGVTIDWSRSDRWMSGITGTPEFLAPEVHVHSAQFDAFAADVWQLGVTSFVAVFGRLPFFANNCRDIPLTKLVVSASLRELDDTKAYLDALHVHDPRVRAEVGGACSFLRAMLEREPTRRWTAAQLLAHPWLCSSAAGGGDAHARLDLAPFVAEQSRRRAADLDAHVHGGGSRDLEMDWSHDLERA